MYRLIEQEAVLQRRPLEFYPSKKKSVVDRTSQKSASIETGYLGPMSSTTDSIGTTVASADYVQSIYGEPTHISDKVPNAEGGYSYSYAYGSSFYIFFDANTNVVTGIFSTANNGLITPAGLTVGMDADAIEQAYGEPWKNDRGYISYHEEGKWLVFTTHNGKITEIKLFDYVV